MAYRTNAPATGPLREGAIEYREMILLEFRCIDHRARLLGECDYLFTLVWSVAKATQSPLHGLVHYAHGSTIHEFLELHQGDVRFDTRSIAIHHK